MQPPIKAHYATQAMLALAAHHSSGQLQAAKAIADQYDIPGQFLGQILQQLRSAGLVSSVRGSNGGFKLARAPSRITVAHVFDAVGCGSAIDLPGNINSNPITEAVSKVWGELSKIQSRYLKGITLADLCQRLEPETVSMFYI